MHLLRNILPKLCLPAFAIFFVLLAMPGCKKDALLKDGSKKLRFSADTLTFDTVFTSLGTTTRVLKIINPFDKNILVSHIYLKGGASSKFRLNIDGVSGNEAFDVMIPAKDSIYVFVAVTVDPNASDAPFIYGDDLMLDYNGTNSSVNLMAWGQNAYFHYGELITSNTTWDNRLPHVLVGRVNPGLGSFVPGVIVSRGATLTINPGVKVYAFNNAAIYCWGTLKCIGTKTDSIQFQGVRLEHYYDDLPGQWQGIAFLRGSTGNEMKFTTINESSFGVYAGADTTGPDRFTNSSRPEVVLQNCTIKNCGFGQFAQGGFKFGAINSFNSRITATNCMAYNTTGNALLLVLGGDYHFNNCTFYNAGSVATQHQDEVLLVSNFLQAGSTVYTNAFDTCRFVNSIVYGSLDEEISLNKESSSPASDMKTMMVNCCIKTKINTDSLGFTGLVKNSNPLFVDSYNGNFHLTSGSPCINSGVILPPPADRDMEDFLRDATFDIGAYEFR